MAFFDFLKRDPTADWSPVPVPGSVKLDLYDREISGVCFGASPQELRRIGRPRNRHALQHGRFVYPGLGLVVEAQDGAVAYAGICLDPGGEPADGLTMADLTLVTPDREVHKVTPWTGAANIVAWLGEPHDLERDETEDLIIYYLHGLTLEVECNTSAEVRWVSAYTDEAEAAPRHGRADERLLGDSSGNPYTAGLGEVV